MEYKGFIFCFQKMVLGEEESRYSFLLKPIRDLTKNWDVDIASHLEEYLEEVKTRFISPAFIFSALYKLH